MRIGILTGGGDCPGLNAVIRAVVRKGVTVHGHTIVGFRHGWRGLVEGDVIDLDLDAVRGLLPRGGTILGSSRTNPFNSDDGVARLFRELANRVAESVEGQEQAADRQFELSGRSIRQLQQNERQ